MPASDHAAWATAETTSEGAGRFLSQQQNRDLGGRDDFPHRATAI